MLDTLGRRWIYEVHSMNSVPQIDSLLVRQPSEVYDQENPPLCDMMVRHRRSSAMPFASVGRIYTSSPDIDNILYSIRVTVWDSIVTMSKPSYHNTMKRLSRLNTYVLLKRADLPVNLPLSRVRSNRCLTISKTEICYLTATEKAPCCLVPYTKIWTPHDTHVIFK